MSIAFVVQFSNFYLRINEEFNFKDLNLTLCMGTFPKLKLERVWYLEYFGFAY